VPTCRGDDGALDDWVDPTRVAPDNGIATPDGVRVVAITGNLECENRCGGSRRLERARQSDDRCRQQGRRLAGLEISDIALIKEFA
jgi:hypothetical protein